MPLIKLHCSNRLEKSDFDLLSKSLSKSISSILNKSEDYIMIIFQLSDFQSFGTCSESPSAFLEFKNVGVFPPEVTSLLSAVITKLLVESLGLCQRRVYIDFQNSERHLWGWNGDTFGTRQ